MVSFLHVVPDDKFIDDAFVFYSELGGKQRWVSYNDCNGTFVYIKNKTIESTSLSELSIIVKQGLFDVIVFHSLPPELYSVLLDVPKDRIIIWDSWGYDIYYNCGYYRSIISIDLFKEKTKKEFTPSNSIFRIKYLKRVIKDIIYPKRIVEKKTRKVEEDKRIKECTLTQELAISRVNMCSTVIEAEFEELSKLPYFHANYYPFKYVHKGGIDTTSLYNGDNILVGNSRDPSNNHLDVLHYLDKKRINNKRVLPLSYGDLRTLDLLNKKYGQDERFVFLTEYLSQQDYFQVLRSCKVAVFGHIRQQALGNITHCILQGSKVYFFKDSLVYKFYRKMGIIVFSIEDDLSRISIEKPLPIEIIEHNRRIIHDLWDYDLILKRTKESLIMSGLSI